MKRFLIGATVGATVGAVAMYVGIAWALSDEGAGW